MYETMIKNVRTGLSSCAKKPEREETNSVGFLILRGRLRKEIGQYPKCCGLKYWDDGLNPEINYE
jgi:hypothetical protein